ncbi:hypothetical protein J6590_008850 [Homalodisca vitripennis]|nr:hypothetical protein J6590_008850 [Homalodisca vitripennis]
MGYPRGFTIPTTTNQNCLSWHVEPKFINCPLFSLARLVVFFDTAASFKEALSADPLLPLFCLSSWAAGRCDHIKQNKAESR